MRLLLDTHTFIWWLDAPENLSDTVRAAFADNTNELIVSVVSLWEIQIKTQLGKFALADPLAEVIAAQERTNQVRFLSVTPGHVLALNGLPYHHKDPFDRLLIAQALHEQAQLVSRDAAFTAYSIPLLW